MWVKTCKHRGLKRANFVGLDAEKGLEGLNPPLTLRENFVHLDMRGRGSEVSTYLAGKLYAF